MTRICSICGSPNNIESAHIVSKGMGGDPAGNRTDTTPLCAGSGGNTDSRSCHGAHHNGELALKRHDNGSLWYTAKGKTAKRLGVKEGQWRLALYEHTDPDAIDAPRDSDEEITSAAAFGELLSDIEGRFAESHGVEGEAYRSRCNDMFAARTGFVQAFGDKRGRAEFAEWHASLTDPSGSHIGVSKGEASRMCSIAVTLPSSVGIHLGAGKQYHLAKAVEQGKGSIAELVSQAEALSISDFRELHWPREVESEVEKVCCPLGFTCTHKAVIES